MLEACSLLIYIEVYIGKLCGKQWYILALSSAFIVATIVLVDLVVRYYSGANVLAFWQFFYGQAT